MAPEPAEGVWAAVTARAAGEAAGDEMGSMPAVGEALRAAALAMADAGLVEV